MFRSFFTCCRGYTFVELLLAITILGIVASPLIALFSGSYLAINNAGNHTVASNLCRDRIESLKSSGYSSLYQLYISNNGNAVTEDNLPDHPGFQRTTLFSLYPLEITPETSESEGQTVELLSLEVTVSWTSRERTYHETVSTLIGKW